MLCSKTKGKFLIEFAKDLATKEPIYRDLFLPEVELPTTVIPQPSIFEFTGSQSLFDWDEEEENELKKLAWNGSWPDTLANRKYKST